ncbi:MAG TPA: (2Fe-2S) ferredoxin domain-containing protein [Candidatus Limnocylindrales bacterium]|nr:(2Fe-2S) ferredoxin domain-containing protein [Candidatus Limnocylindrales bacterium]
MKTFDELKALKQKELESINLRDSKDSIRIVVGMGTCGIAAGARELMTTLLDEVSKRNLTNVTVGQVGCVGLCAREPLIDVMIPGQPTVTYGDLNAAKIRQIVSQHIVNGTIVADLVVNKL